MKDILIEEISGLLSIYKNANNYYFRGQTYPNWSITPSIYRPSEYPKSIDNIQECGIKKFDLDTKILREIDYLAMQETSYKEFKGHVGDRNIDLIVWAYQQHHGPGTIYIDWTYCFVTGLFFSIFPGKDIYKQKGSLRGYLESNIWTCGSERTESYCLRA